MHENSSNGFVVSLTEDWAYGRSESGSHVGVVRTLAAGQTAASFYVNSTNVQNATKIVLLATTYDTTCK